MLSSGTVWFTHLFEVERGEALQVSLWFKQNVAQSRDEMGTWAKSEWLWMPLKTISPAQFLGKSDFQACKKKWVLQGDLKASNMRLQEEKPPGNFTLGIAEGNAQTRTQGCSDTPTYGLSTQGGVWCEWSGAKEQKSPWTGQTCMMAATAQGARAPCEVGLGGPDMGSPALGDLSTDFSLLSGKEPTLELLRNLCNPKASVATFLLWGPQVYNDNLHWILIIAFHRRNKRLKS